MRTDCLVSLVVLSATATLEVLGSSPKSSISVIGFFYEILSSSSELGICTRLLATGSPPITWDLTPLPNPSGNTGVMVCYVM